MEKQFHESASKIEIYDGDRNTLLEEAVEYRATINLLDNKINDLTSQVYMLKE